MLIFDARLPDYFLDTRRDLSEYSLFCLLLLLLFFRDLAQRSIQVEILERCEHERWQEVGVFSVAGAVLCVELVRDLQEAEDFDITWKRLIKLLSKVFEMLFKTAGLILWFIAILCCLDKKSRLITCEYLGAKCVNQSMNFLISSCGSSPSDLP